MASSVADAAHPLAHLFDPGSIAVVGASENPAKRGHQILRALGEAGFRGRIYPIHPRAGTILGHKVYPTIRALPEPAELAVLCTPAATAPELVRECGQRGVRAAIVLAVGFGESGPQGDALETRLLQAAEENGVRVLGPNTSGLMNTHSGANLIGARGVRPGGLALVVQSGNMALALMNEATRRTWDGISICVGIGNEADVGFAEALDFLEGHDDTRAVIVYSEGFKDARAFLHAASRLASRKPVVLIKAARSEPGARAALSHTGAVAGPYDRLRAGLAQAGVVEVLRTDELLHVAETLSSQPPTEPETGVAILSDGGGQGTLAVDVLIELGVPLAALSEPARARLGKLLGPAAAVENPVDLAGAADADPFVFARALEVLADDADVGTVLVVGLFGGYGIRFHERLGPAESSAATVMAETMARAGKGLVLHSMYASHRSPPLDVLGRARVPVVESLEVSCRCVAELYRRGQASRRPLWDPSEAAAAGPRKTSRSRESGSVPLTEPEARALLSGFGVLFGPSFVVTDEREAVAALERLGGPVALKVVSARVTHKTDVGGVALGVRGESEVRAAFREVTRVLREEPVGEPLAALVTRMAAAPLAELLVGVYRDPGLGPVLTIGRGGTWVEASGDVTHRVLPVGSADVSGMLDELTVRPLLDGARGRARADRGAIAEVALAMARCALEREEVEEIEINPLFVFADRVEPVDARAIVSRASGRDRAPGATATHLAPPRS